MGYTGGSSQSPSYNTVCRGDGHTEALKINFDPKVISFEQVMEHVMPQASAMRTASAVGAG